MVSVICKYCGLEFSVPPSRIKKGCKFCSKRCYDLYQTGPGISDNGCGYIVVKVLDHPRANQFGYVYEHIIVAELKLGRPLNPGEVIHHINHIRSDNRPENIEVFPSRSAHQAYHARQRLIEQGIDPDTNRRCYKCHEILPRSEFSPSVNRGKPTLNSACKKCAAAIQREMRRVRRAHHVNI